MMTQITGEAQGWMSHRACGFASRGALRWWLAHFSQSTRDIGTRL